VRTTTEQPVHQFIISSEEMTRGCPIKAPSVASFW
jgi:hypothetical protein